MSYKTKTRLCVWIGMVGGSSLTSVFLDTWATTGACALWSGITLLSLWTTEQLTDKRALKS